MGKNLLKSFIGLAAIFMILSLAETNYAQRRSRLKVNSKQRIEDLIKRIEENTDSFVKSYDEALDDSRLNGTRREDRYTDLARNFEHSTDELRREFDHDKASSQVRVNVRKCLNAASVVNRIMKSRNFGRQTESAWIRLRAELNNLAGIYRLPGVGSRAYR